MRYDKPIFTICCALTFCVNHLRRCGKRMPINPGGPTYNFTPPGPFSTTLLTYPSNLEEYELWACHLLK